MHDSNQDDFLQRIRQALGREAAPSTTRPGPSAEAEESSTRPPRRSHEQKLALVNRLQTAGRELQIDVLTCPDREAALQGMAAIVDATVPCDQAGRTVAAWKHPLIDALDPGPMLMHRGWSFFQTELTALDSPEDKTRQKAKLRERVIASGIGLTSADFCLADTATLVMPAKANQARSVSLVPSTHIALIHLDQLLLDLQELFAVLKQTPGESPRGLNSPYMNLISGPSKTADIEMTMVHGVHGPRTLHLLVLTGDLPLP